MSASGAPPLDLEVRSATTSDREWMAAHATELFRGDIVVSRGRVHQVLELPALVACSDGEPVGVATYRVDGDRCEVVTLDALVKRRGAGTDLLSAVGRAARKAGCTTLWLITTNDNVDALRFYQRRGMRITAVHPGAVDESRRLKPQIPTVGEYGIPLRDEVELELDLVG